MNKHTKFVQVESERDAGDYEGKHRLDSRQDQHQIWMQCKLCVAAMKG